MELRTDYSTNDDEIIYMIKENSEDAKDYLYKKYGGMIHKELNRVQRYASALGIEWNDLVQEALLGFSGAISSYDSSKDVKFSTYATMCVKRKIINYVSKYSTKKNIAMTSALSLDESEDGNVSNYIFNDDKEPLNKLLIKEKMQDINESFSRLNENEKRVMNYIIEGYDIQDIADKLGLTVKSVYNLLYRARKKLKTDK